MQFGVKRARSWRKLDSEEFILHNVIVSLSLSQIAENCCSQRLQRGLPKSVSMRIWLNESAWSTDASLREFVFLSCLLAFLCTPLCPFATYFLKAGSQLCLRISSCCYYLGVVVCFCFVLGRQRKRQRQRDREKVAERERETDRQRQTKRETETENEDELLVTQLDHSGRICCHDTFSQCTLVWGRKKKKKKGRRHQYTTLSPRKNNSFIS